MPIEISGKLEKLKIEAYKEKPPTASIGTPFEVMFNPTTINVQHHNVYKGPPVLNGQGSTENYAYTKSQTIQLDLIIDGTGVLDSGLSLPLFGQTSVAEQVDTFLDLCFYTDGEKHEPKHLRLKWGNGPLKSFDSRLVSVDIEYTTFEKDGSPLRAVLKCSFKEDIDPKKAAAKDRLTSPDLTHRRLVRSGDTLPLLAKEVYGSSKYYLQLAKVNRLNDFRNLEPGTELIFPPLEK